MTDKALMGKDGRRFFIEELEDRYVLHNVPSGEGILDIGWSKVRLDGGNNHTQDDWIVRTKDEEFHLPSGLDYGASICALFDNRNNPKEKDLVNCVKEMFKDDCDPAKPFLMTSTRVAWTPQGPDEVYHRYGYPDMSRIDRNLVGPDGYIVHGFEDYADAMLGTRDVAKVEEAVTWLTGKKPYACRFDKRSNQRSERVLRVGCGDVSFCIGAYGGIICDRPARGVVVRAVARE